jgi:3-phenylpropionate/trans-cinnamate dioxygenase ferredoxin reductase subunit
MVDRVIIAGASLAGGRVAEQLRRGGWEGEIVLVGEEPHRPYDRPPLSKKLLQGAQTVESIYFRTAEWYAERSIELVLGTRVESVDVRAKTVALSDGRSLGWTHLVAATGAHVRKLRGPGADLGGIHYVRTLEDSLRLGEEMKGARRLTLLGAGVIGMEVAATARQAGLEVTVLEIARLRILRGFFSCI